MQHSYSRVDGQHKRRSTRAATDPALAASRWLESAKSVDVIVADAISGECGQYVQERGYRSVCRIEGAHEFCNFRRTAWAS